MPGDHYTDFLRLDIAACGLDSGDGAVLLTDRGDFAILDDIDAAFVGAAGKAPGDRIMARDTAAWLERSAEDRITAYRSIGWR
jgi:hypothetical protein